LEEKHVDKGIRVLKKLLAQHGKKSKAKKPESASQGQASAAAN
jgi:hypothetical protein